MLKQTTLWTHQWEKWISLDLPIFVNMLMDHCDIFSRDCLTQSLTDDVIIFVSLLISVMPDTGNIAGLKQVNIVWEGKTSSCHFINYWLLYHQNLQNCRAMYDGTDEHPRHISHHESIDFRNMKVHTQEKQVQTHEPGSWGFTISNLVIVWRHN